MSYVSVTKQLLGDDLRSLISHFTKIEPSSTAFKKIEDFAWNEILYKYHPTVDDQEIRGKIEGFAEKFLFHGFWQKAENLRKLVEHYDGLEYFKSAKDGNMKWGLILLLMKLSRKPTDALEDDQPIVIENLKGPSEEVESFDWGAFLKEGWEKFKLPEDEISFSEDDSVNAQIFPSSLVDNPVVPESSSTKIAVVTKKEIAELNELLIQEKIAVYLEGIRATYWWKDPEFNEEPKEECYCRKWEAAMRREGIQISSSRLYTEDKVVWELLRLYGSASSNSLFISRKDGVFEPKPNLCISVLNPLTFQEILRNEVCQYLPSIRTLNDFIDEISGISSSDNVPNVYVSYSYALNEIVQEYRQSLIEFENACKEKKKRVTLRSLFIHVKPWLRILKDVAYVHSKAVYAGYDNVDNWMCDLRVLGVLYDEFDKFRGTVKFSLFRLFVRSFSSYLSIVERFMRSDRFPDPKQEFLIFNPEDATSTLQVHPYTRLLNYLKIPSEEFFDPFVSICFRAMSSSHFLGQLDKVPSVVRNNDLEGFLSEQFLNNLKRHFELSYAEEKIEEVPFFPPLKHPFPDLLQQLPPFSLKCGPMQLGDLFRKSTGKSPLKKFFEEVSKINLSTTSLQVIVEKCSINAVATHMEPVGFLREIFQKDFKLLEHLKHLRTVFFVQRIHQFLVYLFKKLMLDQPRTVNWNEKFRDCLSDELPVDVLRQFNFSLLLGVNTKSSDILGQLALIKMHYKPDSHLKSIITDSSLKIYNDIFVFLVQFKWAYNSLFKLRFNMFKENKSNFVRLRRLYSMRMWLIHIMNSFCDYFNGVDESSFEKTLIGLFGEARDLQTIRDAHHNFLGECQQYFFLNRRNPCKVLIQKIFNLCSELLFYWHLELNQKLKDFQLDAMERQFLDVAKNLPVVLQKKNVQVRNTSFSRLFEVIRHNVPTSC